MKKIIATGMTVVLLLSMVQTNHIYVYGDAKAESDAVTAAEADKEMNLSIEDAVKLAKESSREMWKIDDGLKQMQDARKQGRTAKEQAETLMSMPLESLSSVGVSITDNYVETLMAKNGYYITYADTQTKQLEKSKEVLNVGIEVATKLLYYQVLAAEKTIEINEGNLAMAEEQLRVINLKFNNGSATKADVLNGEIAVQKAQTEIDASKDDLEIAKLNLLNKLNLPLDTSIILTDKDLKYTKTADINLEEAIEKAKLERPEVLEAQNNLELQKIDTHVQQAYYTSNLRQNKAAGEKLKDAELNIPQVAKNVELDVRNAYLSLVKAERALLNMDKTVELAKEAARINKLLYENGMATSQNVLEANTNLSQAEVGRYQLLVSYNISKMMFDKSNLMSSVK